MTEDEARRRFADWVMPQADRAFRLAHWLTQSRSDAEDVVQEAALRAFRAIGSCNGMNPRAWFLTIVRHTAMTWLAKNRPKDIFATEDPEAAAQQNLQAEPAFGGERVRDPETELSTRQTADRVTAAIAALPPLFREPLVLREMEDLSYREIAEILDIPLGTVMSRLARARTLLAGALAEERP